MKRETTNAIRFVLEDVLPPVVRDSAPMRWLFRAYWGQLTDDMEAFRARAHHVSDEDYAAIYAAMPRIHDTTDNSEPCIARIVETVQPGRVLDVGCGTGYLLHRLQEALGDEDYRWEGVDFQVSDDTRARHPKIQFHASKIETLPFDDDSFDTVVCTHVLEHILDIRAAVAELRRVCRGRLIVVVPREREHRFTFNPHLHFFPYKHSFLKHMIPVPMDALCEDVGRDILYMETVDPA